MRGSHLVEEGNLAQLGIIPADAGLTRVSVVEVILNRDHPRGCGAHCNNDIRRIFPGGSSPRMRGSLTFPRVAYALAGIIPADAGLTCTVELSEFAFWDHPRGCGAHHLCLYSRLDNLGSSPRMRGSLSVLKHIYDTMGIIPADAGLTYSHSLHHITIWDHPRGCGAHSSSGHRGRSVQGSSPRMRGSQNPLTLLLR